MRSCLESGIHARALGPARARSLPPNPEAAGAAGRRHGWPQYRSAPFLPHVAHGRRNGRQKMTKHMKNVLAAAPTPASTAAIAVTTVPIPRSVAAPPPVVGGSGAHRIALARPPVFPAIAISCWTSDHSESRGARGPPNRLSAPDNAHSSTPVVTNIATGFGSGATTPWPLLSVTP